MSTIFIALTPMFRLIGFCKTLGPEKTGTSYRAVAIFRRLESLHSELNDYDLHRPGGSAFEGKAPTFFRSGTSAGAGPPILTTSTPRSAAIACFTPTGTCTAQPAWKCRWTL